MMDVVNSRHADPRRTVTRRTVIGIAAAASIPAGLAAAKLAGAGASAPRRDGGRPATSHKRTVSENSLPGDPNWDIRHVGQPHEIMGYANRASVRRGETLTLYVSTTARSFRANAFRMGWYHGDRARLVYKSGPIHGRRQRRPAVIAPTNTVEADWGPSFRIPTDDWPEGCYLIRLDAESGAQRFVPVTVRSARTAGRVVIKNE